MADLLDSLSDSLTKLFHGPSGTGVVVSAGPGGPESDDESHRVVVEKAHKGTIPLGYLAKHPGLGRNALGFGGAADAITVDASDDAAALEHSLEENARIARVARRVHDRVEHGHVRMGKWYWLEGHSDQTVGPCVGPYSLFDGTMTAPGAGNSVTQIPIAVPAGTLSPLYLLDRYPGAMYMSLFVSSFAFVPTGATTTGVQECWFTDAGGAVAGLGIYPAASGASGIQNINKQCSSPLTDSGVAQLGTLTVNNLGIAGTPTTVRWQLSIGFIAFLADPWFNQQMIVPQTKAENVKTFLPDDIFA
jgi:hypothetical protein